MFIYLQSNFWPKTNFLKMLRYFIVFGIWLFLKSCCLKVSHFMHSQKVYFLSDSKTKIHKNNILTFICKVSTSHFSKRNAKTANKRIKIAFILDILYPIYIFLYIIYIIFHLKKLLYRNFIFIFIFIYIHTEVSASLFKRLDSFSFIAN